MKKFEIPEMEVVRFSMKDIIATSTCPKCNDCGECGEGKDNCPCNDFSYANQ